ncbi:universal stress protein, partial [Rhodococcus sp. A14]|nr:universal stress protein [Rhodococcus sp. A14]
MSTARIRRGIVAGIDGSDGALEAAAWAASAARRFEEPLRLVHVLPKHPNSADGHPEGDEFLDAAERTVLDGQRDLDVERSTHPGP